MAPLPPLPGVIKAQLVWTIGADTNCMNVLHYSYSGGAPASADLNAIAAQLANGVGAGLVARLPGSTSLTKIVCTDLSAASGQQGSWTGTHQGTSAALALSAATAYVVQLNVNARYRGGHPRAYFPSMTADNLADPQHWTSAGGGGYLTAIETFLRNIDGFTAGSTAITTQIAVSYFQGHSWGQDQHGNWHKMPTRRATPLQLPVIAYTYNPKVGNQRRRVAMG